MRRRAFLSGAAMLATLPVAGCTSGGAGGDGSGGTTAAADPDLTVEMVDTSFDPVEAEVDVGATVEWVNRDSFQHDVTSAQFSDGAASWDVGVTLGPGESATHTFEEGGAYEYYCTIHGEGTMCGAVLVGGVSYDGSLPCRGDGGGDYGGAGY